MDVRLAVQLRLRVPDCSGSKLFILELPYALCSMRHACLWQLPLAPDALRFTAGNLRYALPVLRSPAGRDEGWMRYADFSEIET